jgi:hypothetical protein
MSRTADYTIQGFLYQFNKTALEILNAQNDDTIAVEGIVEDIEVTSSASLKAIQCKYHEASTSFTPSAIYKPLLQMMKHFTDNQSSDISYVLFAHFPGADTAQPCVGKNTMQDALNSNDKELQKYITSIPSSIDLDLFKAKFIMEFGQSYDEIVTLVGQQLELNGILPEEDETLVYPNAIHMIATLSIRHDPVERQVTKKKFISDLMSIRTTAISRWTLALKTRKNILEERRKQLKFNLDKNSRRRYFVINPVNIVDYEAEIVLFISDYIDKYHFKTAHISTPILCLCVNGAEVQDIQRRLYTKHIVATDGHVGGVFQESYFFREPFSSNNKGVNGKVQREFSLRILNWNDHGTILNNRKCDDLYIIGELDCDSLAAVDVNVERLEGATIKEIKYVMGLSNVYE